MYVPYVYMWPYLHRQFHMHMYLWIVSDYVREYAYLNCPILLLYK